MSLSICNTATDDHGRELIEHGTVLFPVAFYDDDLCHRPVPWHWHNELEAVLVTEGTAIVSADSDKYIVSRGEGFFINAGVLHAAWNNSDSNCRFHSVVFHPRLVGGGMDSIFWQSYVRPLTENTLLKSLHLDNSEQRYNDALTEIETAWQEGVRERPGYEFFVRDALSRFILTIASQQPTAEKRPSQRALRDGERIKIMLQYIHEHYDGEITTAQIAQSALISESECLRCFRKTIGVSPIQYVKQFRIQKAEELLISTFQKISDIGAQCGFQDMSYFTKSFRQLRGCTPGEYRARNVL